MLRWLTVTRTTRPVGVELDQWRRGSQVDRGVRVAELDRGRGEDDEVVGVLGAQLLGGVEAVAEHRTAAASAGARRQCRNCTVGTGSRYGLSVWSGNPIAV